MPGKQRLLTTLEAPVYQALRRAAREDGVSLSQKARDLLREALETLEDTLLLQWAKKRERSFHPKKAISHKEIWGQRM